jgi:hypothetical protein
LIGTNPYQVDFFEPVNNGKLPCLHLTILIFLHKLHEWMLHESHNSGEWNIHRRADGRVQLPGLLLG